MFALGLFVGIVVGLLLAALGYWLFSSRGEWETVSSYEGSLVQERTREKTQAVFNLERNTETGEERAYAEIIGGQEIEIPVGLFKARVLEFNEEF